MMGVPYCQPQQTATYIIGRNVMQGYQSSFTCDGMKYEFSTEMKFSGDVGGAVWVVTATPKKYPEDARKYNVSIMDGQNGFHVDVEDQDEATQHEITGWEQKLADGYTAALENR